MAYGLTSVDGVVDAVIDQQRNMISRVRSLAQQGMKPQVTWVRDGHVDELAARVRWSEEHRDQLT